MFTWVVLGFIRRVAELNVEVDVEDGVAVLIPRDYRRGREGWRRDAGLDKGLTKVLHFPVIPAGGYCLAVCYFSTRLNHCHGTIELSRDNGG